MKTQCSYVRAGLVPALAAAALLTGAGCMPTVSSSGTSSVRGVSPDRIQGAHAQAGENFSVTLDQAIDTQESLRHGTFTAHLQSPILASDGSVLAPVGSTVSGHISSLGSVQSPRVRVHFDSVQTVHGAAPLEATLRAAQYRKYPGPVLYSPGYAYGGPGYWGGYGWGGGPGWNYGGYGYYGSWDFPYQPNEVHLPAGARLDLTLVRPLIPPGSSVVD